MRKGIVHNSLPNQDLSNMDDIREKYNSGEAQAREAFEELCAMVDALAVSMIVLNMLVDIGRYDVHMNIF